MSKYNLIDIFEQYQIGSGWTNDFDYEGMLNSGLKTGVDTDIEILRKMSDDFEDVNYHRENNHLQKAIDALEEGAIKEASMFFGDFHAEIKATMETFDMDIEPTLGQFMASKMEENTEAVDLAIEVSQEKAGIKEARTYASVDREVAERIEGMLNISMKAKFLDAWEDLFYDLVEEDPFYVDDVIAHLSNEMGKRIDGNQIAGDRLAGIDDLEQEEFTAIDEEDSVEEGYEETKGKALYPILKAGANATGDEIEMYVKSLAKDIELNGKEQYKDFTSDDYVEDFKNYIADKGLQEHFGRFMKDYQ
jgi:hypothetical protein